MIVRSLDVKEYLSQAIWLEERIDSELEKLISLRSMAAKATSVIREEVFGSNREKCPMENTIDKFIDLENEIKLDLNKLVALKKEISDAIKKVKAPELILLLENRYILNKSWEDIADSMNYSIRNIHYVHKKALKSVRNYLYT